MMSRMSSHTGRKALVTGGANGIGEAASRALAAQGATVVIADRDQQRANAVASEIGGQVWPIDLLDTDGLAGLRLDFDILVNNAGMQVVSPIQDFDVAAFRQIQRLMVEAPFLLVRACLPHMYDRGWGRVVNVSSIHGLVASPYKSAYVTAKHALEGLSKATALEAGPHGVTSNCINPAYVRTALVEGQIDAQARENGISREQVVGDVMLAKSAIKRLIEPAEVGALIAYLASDEAAMVTGASYAIDGGWTAG